MSHLSAVDTIVVVMLENRSFDHMLGHLSLKKYGNGSDVDGLRDPLKRPEYENVADGESYYPFAMRDGTLVSDLPHERPEIKEELALSAVSGKYTMSGFVKAYFAKTPANRQLKPDPMGFLVPEDVPITRFFADQYAVCDRWFSPLPTSTQPNRMMSLSGTTRIEVTKGLFPPTDPLVIDWLSERGVRWRVYHCGISFFALLGRAEIFGPSFRPIDRLAPDVANEAADDFPSVILIEPSFGDAPHIGHDIANDNHPPLPVAPGELLLKQVYEALTCNPGRWKRTVLIVTYDEHGGFFDHVPPARIPFKPAANAIFKNPFESTGPRVPGLVISPLVSPRSVCHELMDHTSILQLIAERFARDGKGYSGPVEQRRKLGVRSVSSAFDLSAPRTDIPKAPAGPAVSKLLFAAPVEHRSEMQQAFADAAKHMVENYPRQTAQQYPELSHWVLTHT